MRYRLTKCESKGINRYHDNEIIAAYTTKYFTRDFRPQKPQIKYTKSLSSPLILTQGRSTYDYDDYFVDVKVGISNVEGTKKIIVEQLDEGETLPFQYEVDKEEFRNGYFIANLDRECSTQLTVVSYNDNGFQRSNTIMIPAIGYPQEELSVELLNGVIHIYGLNPNAILAGEYTYMAQRMGIVNPTSKPQPLTANYIELPSRYAKGIYLMTIFKNNKSIGSFKIQLI